LSVLAQPAERKNKQDGSFLHAVFGFQVELQSKGLVPYGSSLV
jgi:hypothetical protein